MLHVYGKKKLVDKKIPIPWERENSARLQDRIYKWVTIVLGSVGLQRRV